MRPTVVASVILAQAVSLIGFAANAQDVRGVTTQDAIAVFDEVCGKTIPDFANAGAQAAALGYAFNEDDPVKDLLIEVKKTTFGKWFCTVQFGTDEQVPDIIKGLRILGDLGPEESPEDFEGRRVQYRDVSYRGSEHTINIGMSNARKFGRFYVSMTLWVQE